MTSIAQVPINASFSAFGQVDLRNDSNYIKYHAQAGRYMRCQNDSGLIGWADTIPSGGGGGWGLNGNSGTVNGNFCGTTDEQPFTIGNIDLAHLQSLSFATFTKQYTPFGTPASFSVQCNDSLGDGAVISGGMGVATIRSGNATTGHYTEINFGTEHIDVTLNKSGVQQYSLPDSGNEGYFYTDGLGHSSFKPAGGTTPSLQEVVNTGADIDNASSINIHSSLSNNQGLNLINDEDGDTTSINAQFELVHFYNSRVGHPLYLDLGRAATLGSTYIPLSVAGIGTSVGGSDIPLQAILATLPAFASNIAATTAGLSSGDSYYNTTLSVYTRVP